MKLISWNVNGLRALYNQGYWDFFVKEKPDIFCLQETKAEPDQLAEEVRNPEGYFSYFASSKKRKGYSGVALYTKIEPEKVEYGMGIKKFDDEGRMIVAHYKDFVLLNVYFPNAGRGHDRLEYKMEFYDVFLEYIEKLRKKGKSVIFCGDVNTAHEEIDLARPKANEERTGFLPEERAWVDEVVATGFVDTFRHFYPNKKDMYTYWDMVTHSRDRNVGWRIDYFFVSPDLVKRLKGAAILSDVYGSDHAPIVLELSLNT